MKNIPQKIYLQVLMDTAPQPEDDFDDYRFTTLWSKNRISKNDLEYHYNIFSNWIPVELDLPPLKLRCLVYDEDNKCSKFAKRAHEGWRVSIIETLPFEQVRFWSPVPVDPYYYAEASK